MTTGTETGTGMMTATGTVTTTGAVTTELRFKVFPAYNFLGPMMSSLLSTNLGIREKTLICLGLNLFIKRANKALKHTFPCFIG